EVRSLSGHKAPVVAVAYSPDGKYPASGDEQVFKMWNAQTLVEARTGGTPAWPMAFAPASQTRWTGMTPDPGRAGHTFNRLALDTTGKLPPVSVDVSVVPDCAFPYLSRDGKTLFIGRRGMATHLRVIDTATGKERFPRRGHEAPLHAAAVSPRGRAVASAGED